MWHHLHGEHQLPKKSDPNWTWGCSQKSAPSVKLNCTPIHNHSSIQHKPRLAYFKTHVPRGCHTWYPFAQIDPIIAITAIYPRNSGAIAAHFLDPEGPCDVIIFWENNLLGHHFFLFFGWLSADFLWLKTGFFKPRIRIHPAKKHWGFEHV